MRKRMAPGFKPSGFSSVVALVFAFCLAALGISAFGLNSPAMAHGYTKGSLTIEHPWGRPSPGDTKKGAVYLTIKNKGKEADTLVSARADVSKGVEIHNTLQEDGVMKMRKVEDGLKIPAGETIKLAPGGLHIMLLDVSEKVQPGAKFPMTLVFEKAGEVEVSVQVEKSAPHGDDSH
jgi:periplasmic copper chaperone A